MEVRPRAVNTRGVPLASSKRLPEKRFRKQRLGHPGEVEILCVRLDTIGDVLMTGPAMRALRSAVADARLTLLTSAPGAAAAALLPEVDATIVYEAPWMKRERDPGSAADRAVVELLRGRGFELAVIFTVYTQSPLPAALLCHLSDIPRRAAHCRENPYGLLTDWVREPEPERLMRHEVRRQLDLVAALGVPAPDAPLSIDVPARAREAARAALAAARIDRGRPWAVVHPGASAPSRRYPPERWAAACRTLRTDHGVQLVFTGDEGEAALTERAAAGTGPSLAGRLDLAELAALIEAAPLLLAGNTGPVHLAAATETPVVDVYALTNPQHTPWMTPSRVLSNDVPCRWCRGSVCREGHHLCLRGVEPGQVVRAALELLVQRPRAHSFRPSVTG
jgi:lipopolysaccharide heptosyltransferase II